MNSESFAYPNSKDFSKKKRVNRSAKLKQCKLDARREQWLSQVKNKGFKEEAGDVLDHSLHVSKKNSGTGRGEESEELVNHHGGHLGLLASYSPVSVLGNSLSVVHFTGSSSSSGCSGSITEDDVEEEEESDGCFDDWEAVADALAANDKNPSPLQDSPQEQDLEDSSGCLTNQTNFPVQLPKPECPRVSRTGGACLAWRSDDASRPQSLPVLSKQHSFPIHSERHYARGGGVWAYNSIMAAAPSSCPICFEDLDTTDSSFLPCLCGFHLCLFCHKRIFEEDGRCPGCRKPYEEKKSVEGEAGFNGDCLTFHLARSHSMITRS